MGFDTFMCKSHFRTVWTIKKFFRLEVFEDPSKITESILQALDNPKTKIYYEFLSYVLDILTLFNVLFQSEKPVLYEMKTEVIKILQTLFSNYIKVDIFKTQCLWKINMSDSNIFVHLNDIYIGVVANESLSQCTSEKTVILQFCREFYTETIKQIQSRFGFSDDVYTIVDIVNPKIAQTFQPKILTIFKKRFLSFNINLQQLDNEWRHALLEYEKFKLDENLEPEIY